MLLCRYPHCRSYGKLDGLCLVHAKAAAATATTASSSSSSPLAIPPSPPRLAFTPPPSATTTSSAHEPTAIAPSIRHQTLPDDGDDSPLVMVARVPPALPNGRSPCFAPTCTASSHGTTPFCVQHQNCVLLVDTQPRHSHPHTIRKRRRLASIEKTDTSSLVQPLGHRQTRQSDQTAVVPTAGSRRRQNSSPTPTPSIATVSPEHEHAQILANLGRSA